MSSARRFGAVVLALAVSGCDVTRSQMEEDLRQEGVANPWSIEKTKNSYGESALTALDDLHPLGNEFCIANRHLVPIAPHPLSLEEKNHVQHIRAIAWAPCYAVRSEQFHDLDGNFAEADILAALTAVEKFARSGPEAVAGVHVERPLPPATEIAEYVRPEKFCGIFSDAETGFADWPRGSMEIGFNVDPEGRVINALSFSVKVANGKVASIMVWRLYSGGCE